MLCENVDWPLFVLEKTNGSIRNSSLIWIQRPENLCFAIDQFGRTVLYKPVFQWGLMAPQGCSKWCQVNKFLKELYIGWTLLCTIYTNNMMYVLRLIGVGLSENSLSFDAGKGLSTCTRHYAGSPRCAYTSQSS